MKPGQRTVSQTAEFIAEATGLPNSHLSTISRRLREAGLLSQFGRGRGAAAATPHDAALLLLTSSLGVPPLYAVQIADALLDCKQGQMDDLESDDDAPVPILVPGGAVTSVASMIAMGRDVEGIFVLLDGNDLVTELWADGETYRYFMPFVSPARRNLAAKFGQPGKVTQSYRGKIQNGVLPEISEFLGYRAEEREDSTP